MRRILIYINRLLIKAKRRSILSTHNNIKKCHKLYVNGLLKRQRQYIGIFTPKYAKKLFTHWKKKEWTRCMHDAFWKALVLPNVSVELKLGRQSHGIKLAQRHLGPCAQKERRKKRKARLQQGMWIAQCSECEVPFLRAFYKNVNCVVHKKCT